MSENRGGNGQGTLNVDQAVQTRYSQAAVQTELQLCCRVEYDRRYLDVIPDAIIQRDYGCGDPSRHLQSGDVVLDLGSGGGKICYIASQVVGPDGYVIGVDCNDEMLELAKCYQTTVAERIGYSNIDFRKGRIQDLALNLSAFEDYLTANAVRSSGDWLRAEEHARELRESTPLVPDDSVDVVISNCVLNLVRSEDRRSLFREIHRVLRRGGRAVISDIVSDEDVPRQLQDDATLWSGCMSGAFREDLFLKAFEDAGFYGVEILERQNEAWATLEGIEFRSMTVRAWKGQEGPCLECRQAVIYHGPWKSVVDDDGHKLLRGQRMAVCDKTFQIYQQAPYDDQITLVPPAEGVSPDDAMEFSCHSPSIRDPRETKQGRPGLSVLPDGECCGPDCC